jgi:hypothetical protein
MDRDAERVDFGDETGSSIVGKDRGDPVALREVPEDVQLRTLGATDVGPAVDPQDGSHFVARMKM